MCGVYGGPVFMVGQCLWWAGVYKTTKNRPSHCTMREKLLPTIKYLQNLKRLKSSSECLYSSVAILHTQSDVSIDTAEPPGNASVHLYPLRVTRGSVSCHRGLEDTVILFVHPGWCGTRGEGRRENLCRIWGEE